MVSLIGRFERDVLFLEQGQQPNEVSGHPVTSLKYEAEEHEKLTDDDIARLACAIRDNDKFQGQLELQGNGLSDLSALHLSKIFNKGSNYNITKLDLSQNNFSGKAGEYIGQALCENPDYTIFKVSFAKINLEEAGLVRLIEAANLNKHILKLNIGVITDRGLQMLSDLLKENDSLEEIVIEETSDHQKYWTDAGRASFTRMLKTCTQLKKVKIVQEREVEDEAEKEKHSLFKQEIEFYTNMKSAEQKKKKEYQKILTNCEPQAIFESMIKHAEDKDKNVKMPVRKFFNNTFGKLLNDAIFALQKEQSKQTEMSDLFTHEGMVKSVAFHMLDNLPDVENIVQDDPIGSDSGEE